MLNGSTITAGVMGIGYGIEGGGGGGGALGCAEVEAVGWGACSRGIG